MFEIVYKQFHGHDLQIWDHVNMICKYFMSEAATPNRRRTREQAASTSLTVYCAHCITGAPAANNIKGCNFPPPPWPEEGRSQIVWGHVPPPFGPSPFWRPCIADLCLHKIWGPQCFTDFTKYNKNIDKLLISKWENHKPSLWFLVYLIFSVKWRSRINSFFITFKVSKWLECVNHIPYNLTWQKELWKSTYYVSFMENISFNLCR